MVYNNIMIVSFFCIKHQVIYYGIKYIVMNSFSSVYTGYYHLNYWYYVDHLLVIN